MPLLRIMVAVDTTAGERPRTGDGPCLLGVRPRNPKKPKQRFDVSAALPDDPVDPAEQQGLSCSVAAADSLVGAFFRPLKPDERVWEIDTVDLPDGLVAVHRPIPGDDDHWQIEPGRVMTLREFQDMLFGTQPSWRAVTWEQEAGSSAEGELT